MIKIGDFGISRILMGPSDYASTFIGTPYYMSPEVLKHEGYNSKSDIWWVGKKFFNQENKILQKDVTKMLSTWSLIIILFSIIPKVLTEAWGFGILYNST